MVVRKTTRRPSEGVMQAREPEKAAGGDVSGGEFQRIEGESRGGWRA
jgi:hypothetical protein